MNILKALKKLIRTLGFEIKRSNISPYEYLRDKKRYRKMNIKLLGRDFLISDSLSFYFSYKEIFIDEIYKFFTNSDRPTIIDLGSNVGTSILYFKKIYPNAKIIGVEADPKIFEILKGNIINYNLSDIKLFNKAITNTSFQSIKFYQEGADGGRAYPIEGEPFIEVDTETIDSLISDNVDLLKIDIEGSETDALLSSQKLNKVNNIFIEYHSFINDEQTLDKILRKLTDNGFRYIIHTQLASKRPFVEKLENMSMDLQLNIFANK